MSRKQAKISHPFYMPNDTRTEDRPEAKALCLHKVFRVPESSLWHMLVTRSGGAYTSLAADILDVIRFLFLVDCNVRRPEPSWKRTLSATMGVRNKEIWQRSDVQASLLKLLRFTSGDDWSVNFHDWSGAQCIVEPCLTFDVPRQVCLMSEGVDSLSGLNQRLSDDKSVHFLAVTGLTQSQVYGRVRRTLKKLNAMYSNRISSVSIPLYRNEYSERIKEEPSQRIRSILLLGVGVVVALMTQQRSIEIFENGVEMFNFPLAPCLFPEQLSRAMHPTLLALMADFVSTLIDEPFNVTAPFIFKTKGEMIQSARDRGIGDMILRTVSCVHFPQRRSGPRQCGTCPVCTLRQVALFAAGLSEKEGTYQSDFKVGKHVGMITTELGTLWNTVHSMDLGMYNFSQTSANSSRERAVMQLSGLNYFDQQELLRSVEKVGDVSPEEILGCIARLYAHYEIEWQAIPPHVGVLNKLSSSQLHEEVCGV